MTMKISEVATRTGLTKKAINYYEQEGLITPEANPENDYREYSEADVQALMEIQILRQLDVPVKDIQQMRDKPDEVLYLLARHLERLNEQARELEQNKQKLGHLLNLLAEGNTSTEESIRVLSWIQMLLELDLAGRQGYAEQAIGRLFPGRFGLLVSMQYGLYLQEPLDTAEKQAAWLDMVDYLDRTGDLGVPDVLLAQYETMTSEQLQQMGEAILQSRRSMVKMTDTEMEELARQMPGLIEQRNQTYTTEMGEALVQMQDKLESSGYHQHVTRNLEILSKDYALLQKRMKELQERLHLQYDNKGRIHQAASVQTENE